MYAQTIFRAGYVINFKNDTLIGEIGYRGDIAMGEKCLFKLNGTDNITEYKPNDIVGYRFKDDRFFVSKEIDDKKVFLEFLIKGKVNIYYLRNQLTERYFIEKEGKKLEELPYKEETVYLNQNNESGIYLKSSNMHKNILKRSMQDAPQFYSKIDKLKKPEHDDLIQLARDYHNEVCKDESCIVYKKKIPRRKADIEAVGGVMTYSPSVQIVQKNYVNLGVLAHFWLPRVNEKLYFRTGIVYSSIDISDGNNPSITPTTLNFYKIPLQIEYIYPKGKVRPIFAYGFNAYATFGVSVGMMGGLNIDLTKKITLGLNYDLDFVPYILILPSNLFSQGAFVGLKMKL